MWAISIALYFLFKHRLMALEKQLHFLWLAPEHLFFLSKILAIVSVGKSNYRNVSFSSFCLHLSVVVSLSFHPSCSFSWFLLLVFLLCFPILVLDISHRFTIMHLHFSSSIWWLSNSCPDCCPLHQNQVLHLQRCACANNLPSALLV